MKKAYMLMFLMLFGLPACRHYKKDRIEEVTVYQGVDSTPDVAPMEEIEEKLVLDDERDIDFFDDNTVAMNGDMYSDEDESIYMEEEETPAEFAWVEDNDQSPLQTVHFGFNKYGIAADQKEAVKYNAQRIKDDVARLRRQGKEAIVVAEGHTDTIGQERYNNELSLRRSESVAKALKNEGVDCEIKLVGRGASSPLVVDGRRVSGSAQEQQLNRRVEVRVIAA